MIHVDAKKFGNIPEGGWRYVGRRQAEKNRAKTPEKPRNKYRDPLLRQAYVHTVIDDHSRVAYAVIPRGRPHRGPGNRVGHIQVRGVGVCAGLHEVVDAFRTCPLDHLVSLRLPRRDLPACTQAPPRR